MLVDITHPKLKKPIFSMHIMAPFPTEMTLEESDHSVRLLGALLNSSTKSSPRKALYYDDFVLSWIDVETWQDQAGTINLLISGGPDEDVEVKDAIAATWDFFNRFDSFPKAELDLIAQALIDTMTRQLKYTHFERNAAFHGLLDAAFPLAQAII